MGGQDTVEGTPFGRYRLVELLGRGGMGEVWRAYDTATNNRIWRNKIMTVTRVSAATAMLAGLAVGTASTAWADTTMTGATS